MYLPLVFFTLYSFSAAVSIRLHTQKKGAKNSIQVFCTSANYLFCKLRKIGSVHINVLKIPFGIFDRLAPVKFIRVLGYKIDGRARVRERIDFHAFVKRPFFLFTARGKCKNEQNGNRYDDKKSLFHFLMSFRLLSIRRICYHTFFRNHILPHGFRFANTDMPSSSLCTNVSVRFCALCDIFFEKNPLNTVNSLTRR